MRSQSHGLDNFDDHSDLAQNPAHRIRSVTADHLGVYTPQLAKKNHFDFKKISEGDFQNARHNMSAQSNINVMTVRDPSQLPSQSNIKLAPLMNVKNPE